MARDMQRNQSMDSRAYWPIGRSLGATLGRAIDLAQQVATDEVRLLQLESRERLDAAIRRGAWIAFGALCLAVAWVGAWAAALVALEGRFSLGSRLVMLAILQFLLGATLLARGRRRGVDGH